MPEFLSDYAGDNESKQVVCNFLQNVGLDHYYQPLVPIIEYEHVRYQTYHALAFLNYQQLLNSPNLEAIIEHSQAHDIFRLLLGIKNLSCNDNHNSPLASEIELTQNNLTQIYTLNNPNLVLVGLLNTTHHSLTNDMLSDYLLQARTYDDFTNTSFANVGRYLTSLSPTSVAPTNN